MAGTFSVGSAQVGQVIDSVAGRVTSISYLTKPTAVDQPAFDISGFPVRGYFCLRDSGNPLRPLMAVEQTNAGFWPGVTITAGLQIPYTTLILQSIPAGASFQIITV
jgi:hypothetical protein